MLFTVRKLVYQKVDAFYTISVIIIKGKTFAGRPAAKCPEFVDNYRGIPRYGEIPHATGHRKNINSWYLWKKDTYFNELVHESCGKRMVVNH